MQNLEVLLSVVEDLLLPALLVTYVAVSSVATNIYCYRLWSRVVALQLILRQVEVRNKFYIDNYTRAHMHTHVHIYKNMKENVTYQCRLSLGRDARCFLFCFSF